MGAWLDALARDRRSTILVLAHHDGLDPRIEFERAGHHVIVCDVVVASTALRTFRLDAIALPHDAPAEVVRPIREALRQQRSEHGDRSNVETVQVRQGGLLVRVVDRPHRGC